MPPLPNVGPKDVLQFVLRQALARLESTVSKQSPWATYQFVDVTFGSADADYDIPHTLTVHNPENVRYQVVNADRATSIYHDQSATRKAWGTGYLILRSSAASAQVRLLLMVER